MFFVQIDAPDGLAALMNNGHHIGRLQKQCRFRSETEESGYARRKAALRGAERYAAGKDFFIGFASDLRRPGLQKRAGVVTNTHIGN